MSVIVPAHDEERTIGRLLGALAPAPAPAPPSASDSASADVTADVTGAPGALEVVVVCNGCTDGTAEVARTFGPEVTVVETPVAGKAHALTLGHDVARGFPRAVVDADVQISRTSLLALGGALADGRFLASAPRRHLDLRGASWPVRWYYDVWQRLPQVDSGLFGRGVVVVSEAGATRLRELPPVMSDDLVASEAFEPRERTIVRDAVVTIWPSRTVRDLVKRRIRVVTGNAQADDQGLRSAEAHTGIRTLLRLAAAEPHLLPRVVVFVTVAVVSRLLARRAISRGDFTTWQRDDSSRE
jgi:hypothetical protein